MEKYLNTNVYILYMKLRQRLRCTGGLFYFRIPLKDMEMGLLTKGKVYDLNIKEVKQNDG